MHWGQAGTSGLANKQDGKSTAYAADFPALAVPVWLSLSLHPTLTLHKLVLTWLIPLDSPLSNLSEAGQMIQTLLEG